MDQDRKMKIVLSLGIGFGVLAVIGQCVSLFAQIMIMVTE